MFLMGIMGMIISTLYFPVIRAFHDTNPNAQIAINLNKVLNQIRQDVQNSAPAGVNLSSKGTDWTIALVPREWPAESAGSWGKSIRLYQYLTSSHQLQVSSIQDPKDPKGQPMLTGAEPGPIDIEGLLANNSTTLLQSIPFLQSEPWADMKKPLSLYIQVDQSRGEKIKVLRDFSPLMVPK